MIRKMENPYKDINNLECDRCDKPILIKDTFVHCGQCQTDYCDNCIKNANLPN